MKTEPAAANAHPVASHSARTVSPVGRRLSLFLLTVVFTLSYIDRQIINILAEGIKRELKLSDADLGLITGLSFALFYATLGVPVARLAERFNRVKIISAALFVWSGFTIACGLARAGTELFLARVGVGIGEAGSTPPSHSLISELYPADRRASAIAVYSLGIPIGTMIGAVAGGIAMHQIGWRGAFYVAGIPGLFIAVIAWFGIVEPRRAGGDLPAPNVAFGAAIRALLPIGSYAPLVAAMTFFSFHGYTSAAFGASFIFRNHAADLDLWTEGVSRTLGLSLGASGTLGLVLGLSHGTAGLIGTLLGGRLADKFGSRRRQAYVEIPAAGLVVAWVSFLAMLVAPRLDMVIACMLVSTVFGATIFGPVYGSIQSVVPKSLRATASAVTLLVVNLVALGTGPLLVGLISDALRSSMGEADGLRVAMACSCTALLVAAAALWRARRTIDEDMSREAGTE